MNGETFMSDGIEAMRERYGKPVLGPGGDPESPCRDIMPMAEGREVIKTDAKGHTAVDQVGMAEYLRDIGFRYVDQRYYRFDGRFLQPSTRQEMMDEMVTVTRESGIRVMVNTSTRDNVIAYWMSIANPSRVESITSPSDISLYDGWLIPFENGIYSVGRAELLPFTPDVMFKGCVHARYDPDKAREKKLDRRMRNLYLGILGSQDVMDVFLLAVGYTLYSEVLSPPAIFLLIGGGETGKSAILNVLEALLGSDRVANMSPTKLSTQFGLSRLRGMAANLCDESGMRSRFSLVDGDLLKAISAGRPWDSEQKFQDIEKYRNEAKLWFAANSMPDLGDTSSGMMRRVYIFPCNIRQRAGDRIYEKMTAPDALAWLAYNSLKAFILFKWEGSERFRPPYEMERMKTDFCLQDTLMDYINYSCGTIEDHELIRNWLEGKSVSALYEDYKNYTIDCGRSMPSIRNTFRSRLCTEYRMTTKKISVRNGLNASSYMAFTKMMIPPVERLVVDAPETDEDEDDREPSGYDDLMSGDAPVKTEKVETAPVPEPAPMPAPEPIHELPQLNGGSS